MKMLQLQILNGVKRQKVTNDFHQFPVGLAGEGQAQTICWTSPLKKQAKPGH